MKKLVLSISVICLCLTASLAEAQNVRRVEVDGHQMRVRTSWLENAGGPGAPVVVFEAGAGGGLSNWGSVFEDVSEFAAVVAYDRAGMGGSESDGEFFPESEDEFFLTVVDARISFVRDGGGDVIEVILHQNGRDIPWSRVR